jgi:hypothetical protein
MHYLNISKILFFILALMAGLSWLGCISKGDLELASAEGSLTSTGESGQATFSAPGSSGLVSSSMNTEQTSVSDQSSGVAHSAESGGTSSAHSSGSEESGQSSYQETSGQSQESSSLSSVEPTVTSSTNSGISSDIGTSVESSQIETSLGSEQSTTLCSEDPPVIQIQANEITAWIGITTRIGLTSSAGAAKSWEVEAKIETQPAVAVDHIIQAVDGGLQLDFTLPQDLAEGDGEFTVKASNACGFSEVKIPLHTLAVIISQPPTSAREGQRYAYRPLYRGIGPLTWKLLQGEAVALTKKNGLIETTPAYGTKNSSRPVQLQGCYQNPLDGKDDCLTQLFTLNIAAADIPSIISRPAPVVFGNGTFTYVPKISGSQASKWYLGDPRGLNPTFNETTGQISWTPDWKNIASILSGVSFSLEAENPAGRSQKQTFTVNPNVRFSTLLSLLEDIQRLLPSDINGDTIPDLLILHDTPQMPLGIYPCLGDKTGRFSPWLPINFDRSQYKSILDIVSEDFDQDDNKDLLLLMMTPQDIAQALLLSGDGQGNFGQPQILSNIVTLSSLTSVDLDQDGIFDLLGISQEFGLVIHYGLGQGQFSDAYAVPASEGYHLARPFSRKTEGPPDIIALSKTNNRLGFFRNWKDGRFSEELTFQVSDVPSDFIADNLLLADLSSDGSRDLVLSAANSANLVVLFTNPAYAPGQNLFSATRVLPLDVPPLSLVSGDFDHDTKIDLACLFGPDEPNQKIIQVMLSGPDHTFLTGPGLKKDDLIYRHPSPEVTNQYDQATIVGLGQLVSADFDGDLRTDLGFALTVAYPDHKSAAVFRKGSKEGRHVEILLQATEKSSPIWQPIFLPSDYSGKAEINDFNLDGYKDIAWARPEKHLDPDSSDLGEDNGLVFIYPNQKGRFTPQYKNFIVTENYPSTLTSGDLDNDSYPDLVVGQMDIHSCMSGSYMTTYKNINGDFSSYQDLSTPNFSGILAMAEKNSSLPLLLRILDLNGDSSKDVEVLVSGFGYTKECFRSNSTLFYNRGSNFFNENNKDDTTEDLLAIKDSTNITLFDFEVGHLFSTGKKLDIIMLQNNGELIVYSQEFTAPADVYESLGTSEAIGTPSLDDPFFGARSIELTNLDSNKETQEVLILFNDGEQNSCMVYQFNSAYGDKKAQCLLTPPSNLDLAPMWMVVTDVNKDGKDDIVIAANPAATAIADRISVLLTYLGNGEGAFSAPLAIPIPPATWMFDTADLREDENKDIDFVAPGLGVNILYNQLQ